MHSDNALTDAEWEIAERKAIDLRVRNQMIERVRDPRAWARREVADFRRQRQLLELRIERGCRRSVEGEVCAMRCGGCTRNR